MPMATKTTISKLVLLPNEYKERISAGHFDPGFASSKTCTTIPDSRKPLIYVTDPDNMEDEIWVPPRHEYPVHNPDTDSDNGSCSCSERSFDMEGVKEDEMDIDVQSLTSQPCHYESAPKEMWFFRTGWQNRAVLSGSEKYSDMLYYTHIPWRAWGTSLTVRRGNADGDVVADISRRGPGKPFEFIFPDPCQSRYLDAENKLILKFGCVYSRHHTFTYRGRNLVWKGMLATRRLRDVDTDEVIAEFHTKFCSLHRDGKMVFMEPYGKDAQWVDVIVTTALACQQREREIRRAASGGAGGGGGDVGS